MTTSSFKIHEDYESIKNCDCKSKKEIKKVVFGAKHQLEQSYIQQPMNYVKADVKRFRITVNIENNVLDEVSTEKREPNKIVINDQDEEHMTAYSKGKRYFPKTSLHDEDYTLSILKHLFDMELRYPRAKVNYMEKQPDLTWDSRRIVIDWLSSVAQEYKLCDETFHQSVQYIDTFLSDYSVVLTKFQLLAATAMLIASKVEEIYPISAKHWPYLTGESYTLPQILRMEKLLLKVLNFKLQRPTMYSFIQLFCVENKLDKKTMQLALYFSELVLLEGEDYLKHLPSELAAAAIALARHTLLKPTTWPDKLKKTSGYTLKQLSPVVELQHATFVRSPLRAQQAIQMKYKSPEFNRVALLKPRSLFTMDYDDEE